MKLSASKPSAFGRLCLSLLFALSFFAPTFAVHGQQDVAASAEGEGEAQPEGLDYTAEIKGVPEGKDQ